MAKLDVEDIQNEKKYRSFNAYGHSKLAMMLFTYKLSRRLEGTEVTCNAVSPGMVKTNLGRDQNFLSRTIFKLMAKSPKKGAETPIYLATSKEVNGITGKYFQGMKEIKSSEESYNTENAIKIWEISEKLTKLK